MTTQSYAFSDRAEVRTPFTDSRSQLLAAIEGIQPTDGGTRLRMRGKGVPAARGHPPGDLLARVQIRVPRGLDDEAKASLAALGRFDDPEIRKGLFP